MLYGSPYLRNGAPQCCALCNAPFIIEDRHVSAGETIGGTTAVQATPTLAENALVTIERPRGRSQRRCDCCGGKLGSLFIASRWRFCKFACKKTYSTASARKSAMKDHGSIPFPLRVRSAQCRLAPNWPGKVFTDGSRFAR